MKPLKLYMKNIGPFRDETIDFTSLNNMFLIKGDTGAGKTFIFDAMTFALYGRLRGNRKDYVYDLKSHYAADDEDAFVEFEFEIAGDRYRINRNVPFNYINRNGKPDSKKPQADLSVFRGTTGGWEVIPGKLSEINDKMQELIGLSPDEFAKIVILPQGEFAEFLHQNSKERAETLKKLFPVSFYSNITAKIKKMADDASQRLEALTKSVEIVMQGDDFTKADEVIQAKDKEIAALKEEEDVLFTKLSELTQLVEKLKHEKADAAEYEDNVKKLAELDAREAEFEAKKVAIDAAERSQKLREYMTALEHEKASLEESRNALEKANAEKAAAHEKYEALKAKQGEMDALREKTEKDGQTLKLFEDKLTKADELTALKADEAEAARKKAAAESRKNDFEERIARLEADFEGRTALEIINELQETLSTLDKESQALSSELEACRKRDALTAERDELTQALKDAQERAAKEADKLDRTRKTITAIMEKKQAQEEQHKAYSLIPLLKTGMPCPVCGSTEHPSPVKQPEGLLDYDEEIKTHTDNLDSIQTVLAEAEKAVTQAQTKLEGMQDELGSIATDRPLAEVERQFNENRDKAAELSARKDSVNKTAESLQSLRTSLETQRSAFDEASLLFAKAAESRAALEKLIGDDVDALRSRADELTASLEAGRAALDAFQKQTEDAGRSLSAAEASASKSEADVASFSAKVTDAERALTVKVTEARFASVDEALAAFMDDAVLEAERAALSEYDQKRASARDAVEAGKQKKLRAVTVIAADLDAAAGQSDATSALWTEKHAALSEKQSALAIYAERWSSIKNSQNEMLTLQEKLKPLQALSDNLTGRNPQKLAFETWALGMYFQQVVEFASRRFNDISDGRFSFLLKQPDEQSTGNSQRGLDLLVLDSYSGKTSDAAELSGGETFEASISLALAITDVVQNDNGGGIQLDSLFIDEGFGTLDPETLEKAMSVLMELGETRMIGMISHVSEMESFPGITSAISVEKGRQGSHVKVQNF